MLELAQRFWLNNICLDINGYSLFKETPSDEWMTNALSRITGNEDNLVTYTEISRNFLPEFSFHLTCRSFRNFFVECSLCGNLTFSVFSWSFPRNFRLMFPYFCCLSFSGAKAMTLMVMLHFLWMGSTNNKKSKKDWGDLISVTAMEHHFSVVPSTVPCGWMWQDGECIMRNSMGRKWSSWSRI